MLVGVLLVALALALWRIRGALLLTFAAARLAVLLSAVARPLARHTRLPRPAAIGSVDVPTAMATALLYVAVQQVEGNLVTPLLTRRMVDLPPALTLFSIVGFGVVFGLAGVLLTTPLTVVAFVAAKALWIREASGQPTTVPGEQVDRSGRSISAP